MIGSALGSSSMGPEPSQTALSLSLLRGSFFSTAIAASAGPGEGQPAGSLSSQFWRPSLPRCSWLVVHGRLSNGPLVARSVDRCGCQRALSAPHWGQSNDLRPTAVARLRWERARVHVPSAHTPDRRCRPTPMSSATRLWRQAREGAPRGCLWTHRGPFRIH